ncbi:MAG: hypothetical protein JNM30_07985 [Rhodospirillales bacterium]|nr:hypothetical protein [Rhodospirillales bacterium]
MPASVYIVQHVRAEKGRDEDARLVGVYSTKDAAKSAILRAGTQPDFQRFPNGFKISKHPLDTDHWTAGIPQPNGATRY